LRQAITSPMVACTFFVSVEPTASTALSNNPAMKSSFTARRVQPWNMARAKKPEPWKNVFELLHFS